MSVGYYVMIAECVLLLAVLSLIGVMRWLIRRQIRYRIQIVLLNTDGESLLVYDSRAGSLALPGAVVPFDDIPTNKIAPLLETCAGIGETAYRPHTQFHSPLQKYDRIRDDIGPAYIRERRVKGKRFCELFYVFCLNEERESSNFKQPPYPEFYSLREMEAMDFSTRPENFQMDVLRLVHETINRRKSK